MTAINCFRLPGRGVMMTDTALYDQSARVVGFETKAIVVPGLDAVLAVRGPQYQALAFAASMADRYRDFDDLLDRAEADLGQWYALNEASLEAEPWHEQHLCIVGWSRREAAAGILSFTAAPSVEERGSFERPPLVIEHWPDDSQTAFLRSMRSRPGVDFTAQSFDPLTHGIAIMEAQRHSPEEVPTAGDGEFSIIGGAITLTEVREGGVTQRVVHEWSDRVGELIRPAPILRQATRRAA